jgi:hypothetical protein
MARMREPRRPAARVSFAATSDSRDTRRCKARPQRDCRAGLGTEAPQRASVRAGDPPSAGRRIQCEGRAFPRDVRGSKNGMRAAGRRDVTPDLYYFVGSLAMPGVCRTRSLNNRRVPSSCA